MRRGSLVIGDLGLLLCCSVLVREVVKGAGKESIFHLRLELKYDFREDFLSVLGKMNACICLDRGQGQLPRHELHFSTLISFITKILELFRVITMSMIASLRNRTQDGR